jgi:hypothetical protein
MKKQELEALVLQHASVSRRLIEQHGSFHQQTLLIDKRGNRHVIVIADDVLHAPKMRQLLTVYSLSIGGADAILIMSDARMKAYEPGSAESRRIVEAAAQGRYLIADDAENQEVLIVAGRSREHRALCLNPYQRQAGDVIVFDSPEASLTIDDKAEINLIPDIWPRVH